MCIDQVKQNMRLSILGQISNKISTIEPQQNYENKQKKIEIVTTPQDFPESLV